MVKTNIVYFIMIPFVLTVDGILLKWRFQILFLKTSTFSVDLST